MNAIEQLEERYMYIMWDEESDRKLSSEQETLVTVTKIHLALLSNLNSNTCTLRVKHLRN